MNNEFSINELAKLASGFAAMTEHDARVAERKGLHGKQLEKVQNYARKVRAMANALCKSET